ncbi:MAG: response regulator [Verrucomicrobiales bacterium]
MRESVTLPATQNVLVVDDERSIRRLFEMAIESEGRVTQSCADGFAALEMTHTNHYDLVHLDLRMPGLSGIDVLREMRRRNDLTRVVICSAFIPSSAMLNAVRYGVSTFLAKPVTLKILRNVVCNALDATTLGPLAKALLYVEKLNHSRAIAALEHFRGSTNDHVVHAWLEVLKGIVRGESNEQLLPAANILRTHIFFNR